jgi:hypothetical protein
MRSDVALAPSLEFDQLTTLEVCGLTTLEVCELTTLEESRERHVPPVDRSSSRAEHHTDRS